MAQDLEELVSVDAVAGRPLEERGWEPARFEEMRRGAWDPDARGADMSLNGVFASVSFPSYLVGFGGGRLQTITDDMELALAAVRAYNDWQLEGWVGRQPERLIPLGITWLHDPVVGAQEIYRNAERGVRALTFPEAPHRLGLPSIYSSYWEPILRAREETGTVACLHVGSGGSLAQSDAPEAPTDVLAVMFGMFAMQTALHWLFSLVPSRPPNLKIALSEGGIGWLAGVLDRWGDSHGTWGAQELTPGEVLRRNFYFYFCFLTDPLSLRLRREFGLDHLMYEVDYPHSDSTWPNSQQHLLDQVTGVPKEEVDQIAWKTAAAVFQFPVPQPVIDDIDYF
jgi:predicted TIM-barrel fold metal-dependent hydrolase